MPSMTFDVGELMTLIQGLEHLYTTMPAGSLVAERKDKIRILHDRLEATFGTAVAELAEQEDVQEALAEELVENNDEPEGGD